MLRQTFIHIEGVGEATERLIWGSGATSWDEFSRCGRGIPGLGPARRSRIARALDESRERLARGDAGYFARRLKLKESWRLCEDFRERLAFLDIETTGIGYGSEITLVGLYAGGKARVFVRGVDLEDVPSALEPHDVYVTYNGVRFDVPFLVAAFGERLRPAAQIDLMYALRAVGLKGGLKAIERELGIARPSEVRDLDGWDAVRLWREFLRGRVESLRTLAEYNIEDTLNLQRLLEIAVDFHIERRRLPVLAVGRRSRAPGESRAKARSRALERLGSSTGLW